MRFRCGLQLGVSYSLSTLCIYYIRKLNKNQIIFIKISLIESAKTLLVRLHRARSPLFICWESLSHFPKRRCFCFQCGVNASIWESVNIKPQVPPQELLNTELVSLASALDVSPMVISRALSVYAHRYKGSAFSLGGATAIRTQTSLSTRTD